MHARTHWAGGQIKDDDSSDDVKFVDLSQVHYLSGPIRCEDADGKPAMPGDLLKVELVELGPLPGDEWGFVGTFDRDNGGGFLTGHSRENESLTLRLFLCRPVSHRYRKT